MLKVTPGLPWPLHDVATLQRIEQAAAARLPPHTLMARAGLGAARLALAIAPHARRVWIACGPGNNGGDGFEAAVHLHAWGKQAVLTLCGDPAALPPDAKAALAKCELAGLALGDEMPTHWDLCLDALLGIGANRSPSGAIAAAIERINSSQGPVIALDLPSGLAADTGHATAFVRATHTVSFLGLKPGLFTASGRDAAGQVWLDDLGVAGGAPTAMLTARPDAGWRAHASHKGTYGDVAVVGGDPGMLGAALLAAQAALHAGAGRVFLAPLDPRAPTVVDTQPELMVREPAQLPLGQLAVVCGCGGGTAVAPLLPQVLREAKLLVLDADALNALAADTSLQAKVRSRGPGTTVLTPHPLEAARLLGMTTAQVQADRLQAARLLVDRFGCVAVVKGSGTVIAAPGELPRINPTGNASLATGGTGDVLAGLLAARMAQGHAAFDAACAAVYEHGAVADDWPADRALTAAGVARRLRS